MQKLFSKDKYNEIMEKCNAFKQNYVDLNETEVYVQLVHESNGFDGLRFTLDVYPKKFLYHLMDYALSDRTPKIPLFSYTFTTKVDGESYKYKEYKALAQENNGWLKAQLCNEDNSDFFGLLIWQCGGVIAKETGLKVQGSISSSDMKIINRTASGFEKKCPDKRILWKAEDNSESATSYEVNLYRVGNANTALITNTQTSETLLLDCGIDINYRNLYSKAENEIKMLDPEYVLLSHNHEDHYNLLFCNGATQAAALGLARTYSNLKRIYVADNHQGSLKNVINNNSLGGMLEKLNPNKPDYQNILTSAFPNIFINFGTCPGLNSCVGGLQSSLENDIGMIVSIKNNQNIVFTGDCSFDFIPLAAGLSDADYIVIPHHGGKGMMNNPIRLKSNCVPIVSSGFTSLFPKTSINYQAQYDQGLFLQKCGVTSPLLFLKSIQNSHYTINNV